MVGIVFVLSCHELLNFQLNSIMLVVVKFCKMVPGWHCRTELASDNVGQLNLWPRLREIRFGITELVVVELRMISLESPTLAAA